MNLKKYFKSLSKRHTFKEPISHHKGKFGFNWWNHNQHVQLHQKTLYNWRRKFKFLFTIPVLLITLLFAGVAFAKAPEAMHFLGAQFIKPNTITQSATVLPANVQSAIQNLASQEIKQEQSTGNLAVETANTPSVQTPSDNIVQPLVFAIQEALTTNPSDKAKLRLAQIDGQILELQTLLQNDRSDKAVNRAVNLIKTIGQETDQVVANPNTQGDRAVLGAVIQQYSQLQLVIQKAEDQLPVDSYLKIDDARETYLEKSAKDSLNSAPNLEVVNNIGVAEVTKIVGKDFAELKSIEILSDLQEGLKPETKVKLAGIQKELAVQFEKRMLSLPPDVRNRKMQNYINYSYGNPLNQVQAFNSMQNFLTDRDLILSVATLKELSLKKLENRVSELNTPDLINQFSSQVLTNPENIDILVQMKMDTDSGTDPTKKQQVDQLLNRSVNTAITTFGKDPNTISEAFPPGDNNGNLLDVLVINQLAQTLNESSNASPEIKQAVTGLKQQILTNFISNITKSDFVTTPKLSYNPVSQNADVRLLLPDPGAISSLEEIKTELSDTDKPKIAIAQKATSTILANHLLLQVNDPVIFDNYQQFIINNPQVQQIIQSYVGQTFFTNLTQKKKLIDSQNIKDQQTLYEKMQAIVQQIFISPNGNDLTKQLPTDIQTEIAQLKQELPNNNVPKLDTPEGVTLPQIAKLPDSITLAIIQTAQQQIKNNQESTQAKLDLTVQAKDLGVNEPTILPGNLFYPVLEIIREVPVLLTTDPIEKAQKQLIIDNERILEAAKLLENSQSQETVTLALNNLDKITQDLVLLKDHTDDLKKEDPTKVDQLVNQIIENGVAKQTVLSSIESKVQGDDYVKAEVDRQTDLKNGVDVLLDLTNQDAQKLTDKLETTIQNSQGSELKDIKAVELLTEISRTQPEATQQVIEKTETSLAQDLETKLLAMPQEQRTQEVLAYAENAPGNPIRQFEAYDSLKTDFKDPETIALTEGLKDKAIENLTQKISEIPDATSRQEFVDSVVGDQPQDLKIITEIEQRVAPPTNTTITETLPIVEKIQDIQANIEQNIVETYKDKPDELAKTDFYLSATGNSTVDITDIKVGQDIVDALSDSPEVSPEVITVAKQEESKIINTFIEDISKPEFQVAVTTESSSSAQVNITPLASQILNPVPETLAELVDLKNQVSQSDQAKIDVAIEVQVKLIEEHITTEINDPVTLQTYIAQIEENPVVAQTVVQVGGSQFSQAVDTKAQEIQTVAIQQQTDLQTTVTQIQQEIFSSPINNPAPIEQTLPQTVQDEIQQVKQQVPEQQIPQVEVAATVTITTPQETQPTTVQPTVAPIAPTSAPAPAAPEVKAPEQQSVPPPTVPAIGL